MTPGRGVHARNPIRIGVGKVSVRWSQLGFGAPPPTSTTQATPRNLFGFKDGTNNLKAEGARAPRPARLGPTRRPAARARVGVAGRRVLPGRPPDPDAHRGLGQHRACRSRNEPSGAARAGASRWVAGEFDALTSTGSGRTAGHAIPRTTTSSRPRDTTGRHTNPASATTSPTQQRRLGRLDAELFFITFYARCAPAVRADAASARGQGPPQRIHRPTARPLRLPARRVADDDHDDFGARSLLT